MKRSRIILLAVIALLALLVAGWFFFNKDASAPQSRPSTTVGDSKPAEPERDPSKHDYFDVSLARQMVTYNQQAIEIANRFKQNAASGEVRTFAETIVSTHTDATKVYTDWLNEWKESYLNLSEYPQIDGHDSYPTMSGMATIIEMKKMEAMSSDERSQEFLRLMLQLHKGSLEAIQSSSERIQYGKLKEYLKTDQAHYENEIEQMQVLKG